MSLYQKGGQRRTIEAGCGWRCVGHPTEVNKKYARHKRVCKDCKESNSLAELPEFDKTAGLVNGWKGITNRNQQPNQMLTTAYIDGERNDLFINGVTNMEDAMSDARLTAALIADKVIPSTNKLSKEDIKKMKRQTKEKDEKELEEIMAFLGFCKEKGDKVIFAPL